MANVDLTHGFGAGPAYRQVRRLSPRQRALAWGAVVVAHGLAVAALIQARVTDEAPPVPTIMVSLVPDAAATPSRPAEPPPPQPSLQPRPEPKMVATAKPTTSPLTAPPPEEPVRAAQPQAAAPQPTPAAPNAPPAAAATTTPPNFTAAYLNNPLSYPYESRRKREEGVVRLKVLVSADGRAEQVLLDRTSGFPTLDAAALDIVKKRWRFVPARQGDKAVSAWVVVPVEFELKNR
jgi:periplasmic protein TonB